MFLDEDHSGGWHEGGSDAYNAFAYHISTLYDAVDLGVSGAVSLNDHVDVVITQDGNIYTWEIAIQIYDDTYDEGGSNTPVTLTENKEMGLSLAYCDNDGTGTIRLNLKTLYQGTYMIQISGNDIHYTQLFYKN
ncbi:hypothetical protein ES705_08163 [subsurface metagenome]